EASSIAKWFTWPARFFSLGPTVSQTLFDKGRRAAATEAAFAQYDSTVANYRQTVLTAFQEGEDNLAALRILSRELDEQNAAVACEGRRLYVARVSYKDGIEFSLDVITAITMLLANNRSSRDVWRAQNIVKCKRIDAYR